MIDYSTYDIEDFVADSSFKEWVTKPTPELNRFWIRYKKNNPDQKHKIEEAVIIVHSLEIIEPIIPNARIDRIWQNINKNKEKSTKRILPPYLQWAAVFFIALGSGYAVYNYYSSPSFEFSSQMSMDISEAYVVLSDGSKKVLTNEDTQIEVNDNSEVIIDSDTLKSIEANSKTTALNQVVLPYGKQTNLQLSDGTTVYLNAGTKFSFPSQFSGSKREVFLQGEAKFEVAKNKEQPFIVHTSQMDIFVTGTEFNVSAYEDDTYTQTVLVSGTVNVSKPGIISKKIKIKPGEAAIIESSNGKIVKNEVDAESVIAWTRGYLIFQHEELSKVIKKVERYYNQKIETEDQYLLKRKFTGKLDIQNSIDLVMDDISFAAGVKILRTEEKETLYIIKP